ncbi:MAG: hypothetical protein M1828_004846 [Chrysothrix sp. TS-e1954]|nr:MAG: hypothetical protein M1828_004846 [Chrysothrix sp. TS-e1954]
MRGLREPSLTAQQVPRLSLTSIYAALVASIRTSKRRIGRSSSPLPYSRAGRSKLRPITRKPLFDLRLIFKTLTWTLLFLALIAFVVATAFPSYTKPPPHYTKLAQNAKSRAPPGRANLRQEKVFIAASLYDPTGELVDGPWGRLVQELVELLGPNSTFLSIYESDSGPAGALALKSFEAQISCEHRFTVDDQVNPDRDAVIQLPDGGSGIKRIDYLAAARNRALEPLHASNAASFDKILYLNDVIFDPIEAAQLLFSTNIQSDGTTSYKAACALDFKSPFLMYDKLALRDDEGFGTGVPLFPFFTTSGFGRSRSDTLDQKDAVRVKSCWGGLVAFDAKNFQSKPEAPDQAVVKFRSEGDLFWEYSECCLVHADLQEMSSSTPSLPGVEADSQIYVNPYIRTAYSVQTFRWLAIGRRLERMASPIQSLINYFVQLPYKNERRLVKAGEPLSQLLYEFNSTDGTGSWNSDTIPANAGGFCGIRNLMVKRLDHSLTGIDRNWETISKASWSNMPQPRRHIDDT